MRNLASIIALRLTALVCLAGAIGVAVGCGSRPQSPSSPAADTAAASPVTRISPEVPLGDFLPVLDGGRLEIAPPAGWSVLPRDNRFLTRFFKDDRRGLPRLEIRGENGRCGDLTTITETDLVRFAESVAKELDEKVTQPLEPVLPMMLGDVPCVRYVVAVTLKLGDSVIPAERQRLLVLRDGRLYTIDLTVLPHTLKKDRDAAYAVCAGLRFIEPKAAQPSSPAGETPADSSAAAPAEAGSAEPTTQNEPATKDAPK